LTSQLARLVIACAVAALILTAPASAPAATSGSATFDVAKGTAGKALKRAGVRVRAVKPAKLRKGRFELPTASVRLGVSATIRHKGGVRFQRGRRKVTFTSLQTTLGPVSSVTGRVGGKGKRLVLFTVRPAKGSRVSLDPAVGTAALSSARVTLHAQAVRVLRKRLKTKRIRTGSLGAAVIVGTDSRAGRRTAGPGTTGSTPGGSAGGGGGTTQPAPPPPTPVEPGWTVWTSSHLPGTGDHKSFINYLTQPWGCLDMPNGQAAPEQGATYVAAGNKYDFRLPQASVSATRVVHTGQIHYTLPCHGLDQSMGNLEFDLATGRVYADGLKDDRSDPFGESTPYTDRHVLDLELASATRQTTGNATTYTGVRATVAAGAQDIVGDSYPAGTEWGAFSFTVPAG
jgi:hypothetical protein